jgi:hypothetical protein
MAVNTRVTQLTATVLTTLRSTRVTQLSVSALSTVRISRVTQLTATVLSKLIPITRKPHFWRIPQRVPEIRGQTKNRNMQI